MRLGNVLVRRAHADDLPRLVELLGACVAGMRAQGIDQWDEVYPTEATLRADIDAGTLYAAAAPGRPVAGAITVDQRSEPEYTGVAWQVDAPASFVHRLMVHPDCQRRGLARHLMGFAEIVARKARCSVLRLDALLVNPPSLRLYETLGYQPVGQVRFRKGPARCFEKALAR